MRLPGERHPLILLLMLYLESETQAAAGAVAGTGTGTLTGPEFLGGSMSFEAFDDQSHHILVNAKILTGWRLGKGQCGLPCDHTSIGTDITGKRNDIMTAKGNPTYFGHWEVEEKYQGQIPTPRVVTTESNTNVTIQVMAVNDILGWELDKAEVTIKINELAEYTDFIYEGQSWTPLTKQPTIKQWHMQLKVNAKLRSDTNRRNRSPIVQITPYMKLGIDRHYTLSIPTIDQDGDHFECRKMAFIEFLDLQTSYHLKNVVIQKDCFIHINTASPEYQVGDSAVIAVTIQDFNRENIKLTGDPHPLRQRYTTGRSLSAVPVQFYIEIVLKDESPVIIDPTPPEQQMFTIFVGSDLQIKVVAKPTNPTRTVSTFFFTRRDGVVPQTSGVTDETSIDPLAKGQAVLWTPVTSDLGDHILCVRVEDSAGSDALPRCFIIRVKAAPVGVGSQIVQGKPAFIRFPSNGEISCLVGSNCRFPIYAVSSTPGGITGISLTSSDAAGCHVDVIMDASAIHPGAKMVDISFQDPSYGRKKICLRAADANAVIEKCFEAVVQPRDPCELQPCQNGAECVTNGDKTSYVCMCPPGYKGLTCDKAPDKCIPNPCKSGGTCHHLGFQFECLCTSGYWGVYCDNTVDKCQPDPCSVNGVCEDTTAGYTCHCQDGYSGNDCTGHPRPPANPCIINPTATGCSCGAQCVAPNGVCVGAAGSGTCLCSKGYSGPDCQSQTTHWGQDPIFVPPTPEAEDLVKCEKNKYANSPCIFAVYTSHDAGLSTGPLVTTILPPSEVIVTVSSATDPNIPGILNIYRYNIKIQPKPNAAPRLHICLQVAKSTDSTHPTDTKCFNVEYVFKHGIDPWGMTPVSPKPSNKFVDPTLPDQSEIVCEIGKPCHFFVFASKEGSNCKHVLTSDTVSTAVFDPSDVGTSCMTNVVYDFTSSAVAGTTKKLCLKAGDLGDVRCFYMKSVATIVDHCASSPCKNGGVCGSTQGTFVCTCTAGFTGLSCEKGPCPATVPPHCNNGGYCYVIGATKNCFCKLGFSGPTCTDNSKDTVVNPQTNGGKFKDGTIPKEVKCYVGIPCKLPTTLIGDPGTSPVVSPGYVNGNLDVHGTSVTKDPSSSTDYHASVEVVSKTSGKHQICIQSKNPSGQSADEVCFMVNAVSGQLNLPSQSHAYYVEPTLPDGSSVECVTGKPCHLSLWVHNFDGEDACPSVKSSQEVYTGVYMHQPTGTSSSGPCKVDVVFQNDLPKQYTGVCFTATSTKHDVFGGDGEVRCYDVNIVNALSVVGSCSSTLCQNGAFCDGHRATPKCACLSGFSGPLCHQRHGESLTNPATIPGSTQSTFGDLAVPKEIKCILNQECEVPFAFTKPGGGTGTIPSLQLGQVDGGVTVTPTVSTDPHTPAGTYQGKLKVVGNTPGHKKVCVHTPTSSPGIVGDDICFDVDVTNPTAGSTVPNVAQPHFIEPTVQPDSTLQCEPGKTCHVIMQMSPGINHGCPSVVQTQGPSDDLHLFHSDSSNVIGSCSVDVTLTPPASKHGTDTLCFDSSLPYIPGESRCFKVDYSHIVSGPCHGVTCLHGGVCGANGQCVCPIDHSGSNCQNSGNQGPAHTTTTPKFTDMALPTNIKCEINKECLIPLMVNGAKTTLPHIHVGHTDIGVDVKSPVISQTGNLPPGVNQVVLPITGKQLGNKKVCVQALQTAGTGLDEQCFTVEITNPGSTLVVSNSNPHFKEPTLPDGSTVSCDINKACHMILLQTPDPVAGCPSVSPDATPGGLYVMNPISPTNGVCRTDVSFTPSGQGDDKVCLTAALPSVTGEKRCYTLHVPGVSPAPTPCESKNCQHGGLCTGDPSGNTATCSCAAGYSGADCSTVGAHNIGATTGNTIQPSAGTPPVVTDTVVPDTVSCVVNTVCHVPVLVTGDPNNPPTLTPVRNDPGTQGGQVTVPQPPHQLPGSPPGTYKGDITVTSTTQGMHTSCVQTADVSGNTAQTVCFKVNMMAPPAPGSSATSSGQQIVEPTLPDGSVIKCSKGKSCHILVHTASTGSHCDARVTEKGVISGGIDVFAPAKDDTDGTCVTDIRLPSDSVVNQHVCFQVAPIASGGNTESRCYDLHINQDPCITMPCPSTKGTCIPGSGFPKCQCKSGYVGLTCNTSCGTNGGVCIAPNVCICPPGKIGTLCGTDGSIPIPGSPSVPAAVPTFVDTALLKSITCVVNQPCAIPMPVKGSAVTPSDLQFGQVDTGITKGPITVGQTQANQNMASFTVTPTTLGNKRVCVQTKTTASNVDEVCVLVNAVSSSPSSGNPPPGPSSNKPQFTSPSLPDTSVVECKSGSTCYIHLATTPGTTDNSCPDVIQTAGVPHMQNLVVIPSSSGGSSPATCTSTVAIRPTSSQSGNHQVCLSPTKTSGTGMQRCLVVHVTGPADSTTGGPCQAFHCQNNGQCVADMTLSPPLAHCDCTGTFTGPTCATSANSVGPCSSKHCLSGGVCIVKNGQGACLCPSGKTGDLCENDGSTAIPGSPTVSSTDPVFVDTALPKTVTCFVGKTCTIPLPVSGTGVTPSDTTFGLVDPGITPGQVTVHPLSGNSQLLHIPVTPTYPGNKHVCIQTKTATSNVDEVCFTVNAVQPPAGNIPPPPDASKPQFTPTLPDNCVVECEVDSPCHIHLATTTGASDNTCPDVTQTGLTQMKNLVAFSPASATTSSTTCSTDVTISPTSSEVGDNHVCLTPTKASGDQGKPRCVTVQVVGPNAASTGGPCQTLHCQNNGQCIAVSTAMPSSAHCSCSAGFNGPTCDTALTTVDPCSSTHMVCQNGGVCKNNNGHAFCLCPPGWTGTNCQTDSSLPVNGVTGSQPDPTFIDTAIPKVVLCPVGQVCTIPLLLQGSGVTSSSINFGQVDGGITHGPMSVTPTLTSGTQNLVQVHVTPTTVGEKRVCVQTNKPNQATKGSEACFTVKTTQNSGGTGPASPDHSKPQFTPSTLPDHSTVQCQAGSTCHIYFGTLPVNNGPTCPSVVQSGVTHMQNMQSFPLTASPSSGNICHSVMSFTPAAGPTETRVLCFTPTQGSGHGQEKCLNIIVKSENCDGPVTDMNTAKEAAKMGRATCKCTLTSGKEVVVINKRPKATTVQLLKAAGIGAGSVTAAIAIATIIYMIVGKIKDAKHSKPSQGGNTANSDRTPPPQSTKPRPQPRQRR